MPSIRLTIALSISIAFVVGAIWLRFGRITYTASNIEVVNAGAIELEDRALEDFLPSGNIVTIEAAPAKPLSQTDLISRQLFSDYVGLASSDKTSSTNINSLAEQYADEILGLFTPKSIDQSAIKIIGDSEKNLSAYSSAITSIYNKYKILAQAQFGSRNFVSDDGTTSLEFMSSAAELYQRASGEFLTVEVPASLANNHLELVSTYSGNAEAMSILSTTSSDPVKAISAINILTKNSRREPELLTNIRVVLMANGVIFDSSI